MTAAAGRHRKRNPQATSDTYHASSSPPPRWLGDMHSAVGSKRSPRGCLVPAASAEWQPPAWPALHGDRLPQNG